MSKATARRSALEIGIVFLTIFPTVAGAAPPTTIGAESLYQAAIDACDRGDLAAAQARIAELKRHSSPPANAWVWGADIVVRAIVLLKTPGHAREGVELLKIAPPKTFAASAPAAKRLLYLAWLESDAAAAQRYLDEAARLIANGHPGMSCEVDHVRARLASNADRLGDAERYLHEAIRKAKASRRPLVQAKATGELSRILGLQEKWEAAYRYNEQALKLAREQNMPPYQLLLNQGWLAMRIGELELADQYLGQAAASVTTDVDVLTALLNRGNVRYEQGDYPGAMTFYRQVAERGRVTQPKIAGEAMANLATVALEQRDYPNALRYNQEAQALKGKDKDAVALLWSQFIAGRIAAAKKEYGKAEQIYKAAMADHAVTPSSRWELQTALAELYAATGRAADAERAFRSALETTDDAISDLQDDALKMAFPATIVSFFQTYVDFLFDRRQYMQGLQVADRSRARALIEGLRPNAEAAPADPKAIARNAGAVILFYWLAPTRSLVWIVTPKGAVDCVPLPGEGAIAAVVARHQEEVLRKRPLPLTADRSGAQLYRMLVEPVAKLIPSDSRVVVISDRVLSTMNFETLIVLAPRPHYWIEDVTITNASSLRFVGAPLTAGGAPKSILLIGNARPCDGSFPELPQAGSEIARVGRYFSGARELQSAKATPAAYGRSKPGAFDVIHFAAHAAANRLQPLQSAVILGCDRDGNYKLTGRDIIKHPLNAQLVTISSCRGAGNRTYTGEGLVGLAWAFLRAGARQVIAALWEVDDNTTPELMDAMYARIRAGVDPATALRQAKLAAIARGDAHSKPRYWAPFVLYSGP
ncbi:MAG TPA: CHAT domain-containing protein [Thermoanaerobaculia bacterium]|nr:CHAT domain-containing protein [Thermoanaerobaculia bacterium]